MADRDLYNTNDPVYRDRRVAAEPGDRGFGKFAAFLAALVVIFGIVFALFSGESTVPPAADDPAAVTAPAESVAPADDGAVAPAPAENVAPADDAAPAPAEEAAPAPAN
ncbi:hypothetical protein HKCCE2091_05385 [Rhodobacterales bacterium HKCCE2091]|nr:hypothetical protein [Rhodobacterales bacterium HKCCE2091]